MTKPKKRIDSHWASNGFDIWHWDFFRHSGLGFSHFPMLVDTAESPEDSGSFCGVKSPAWPGTLYS